MPCHMASRGATRSPLHPLIPPGEPSGLQSVAELVPRGYCRSARPGAADEERFDLVGGQLRCVVDVHECTSVGEPVPDLEEGSAEQTGRSVPADADHVVALAQPTTSLNEQLVEERALVIRDLRGR